MMNARKTFNTWSVGKLNGSGFVYFFWCRSLVSLPNGFPFEGRLSGYRKVSVLYQAFPSAGIGYVRLNLCFTEKKTVLGNAIPVLGVKLKRDSTYFGHFST